MLLRTNKFLLYILLTLFLSTTSFSCALCQMDIPIVTVDTKVSTLPTKTHFKIKWKFDEKFVSNLTQYDLNENGKFDKDEKDAITKALENYLYIFNYLTKITYSKRHFISDKIVEIKPNITQMVFENGSMYYIFDFDTDFILQNDYTLNIKFEDTQENFNFTLKDIILDNYQNKYQIKPSEHFAQIIFNDHASVSKMLPVKDENTTVQDIKTQKEETINIEPIKTNSFLEELSQQLKIYKEKIQTLLSDIKQNNSISSYLWLLFFSFIYGILHALGPGHGKSLVGSYFLSQNRSVLKAFNISLLIGIVHTFSAFFLTVFIYLVLNLLFVSFLTDIEYVATKLSAIIIISIALYLIYKKYKTTNKLSFTTHNPNNTSCGCSGCNTKSEDLGVILAAGIVPCPGTVTIFIFTFGLGIYYVGFLSAIFMSLGMSLIIFVTAYLSINVRKKSSSNATLTKLFEYGSLVFILGLGLFLLIV